MQEVTHEKLLKEFFCISFNKAAGSSASNEKMAVYNIWEGLREEAIVGIVPEMPAGSEENTKKFNQDSRCPGRNSK
jgi:hypothetical protein